MKKTISVIAASLLAVSAVPLSVAVAYGAKKSAEINVTTISKEIIEEDVTVDGLVIPKGSAAFTVNIGNNQGFSVFEFDIDIDESYEIFTDGEGRPLFTKCDLVNYSSNVKSAEGNGKVSFTGVFEDDCKKNGGIITFYATDSDSDDYEVSGCTLYGSRWREYGSGMKYREAGCPLKSYKEESSDKKIYDSVYMVGDFNGDMNIDMKDAFIAYQTSIGTGGSGNFETYVLAKDVILPDIADVRAAFIWNDFNDSDKEMLNFRSDVADRLLEYCADCATGKTIVEDSYIGMICHS